MVLPGVSPGGSDPSLVLRFPTLIINIALIYSAYRVLNSLLPTWAADGASWYSPLDSIPTTTPRT